MPLLSQNESYILKLLYISLILFNLIAPNSCYEVDDYSEFDTSPNGLEEYVFGESYTGLEFEESHNELEVLARMEQCVSNGRMVSGISCEHNLQLWEPAEGGLGLPVSMKVVSKSTSSRNREKVNAGEKYKSYLQRFVNLFLKTVHSSKSSLKKDTTEYIKLEFIINDYQLNLLQRFGRTGEKEGVQLEDVSDVLTSIFSQSPEKNSNYLDFISLEWMNFTGLIFRDPRWTILYTVLLMFVMTLWFAKTHSFRLAFFTLFLTIFFAGFGCNWMRMYEEKEVEKYVTHILHNSAPYHCTGNKLAWYEVLFYKMFGEDCFEFYKVRDVPSMISVSPTDVLAETFTSMIVNPSVNIGKAYGSFINNVASSVPFLFKPIAIVMGFIVPLMFIMVILCFFFEYQLSLSLLGFHLSPGLSSRAKHCIHNSKSKKYIEDMSSETDKKSDKSSLFPDIVSKGSTCIVTDLPGLQKLTSTRPDDSKVETRVVSEETILEEGNHSTPDCNETHTKLQIDANVARRSKNLDINFGNVGI